MLILVILTACDQGGGAAASTDRQGSTDTRVKYVEDKVESQTDKIEEINNDLDTWIDALRDQIPEEELAEVDAALSSCEGHLVDCEPVANLEEELHLYTAVGPGEIHAASTDEGQTVGPPTRGAPPPRSFGCAGRRSQNVGASH